MRVISRRYSPEPSSISPRLSLLPHSPPLNLTSYPCPSPPSPCTYHSPTFSPLSPLPALSPSLQSLSPLSLSLPSLPLSPLFPLSHLSLFPPLSATQCHGILAAGPAMVEWTLGQQPGRSAGAGRKRKRGRETERGRRSTWEEQGEERQAIVSESDVARFNSLVLRLADVFSSSSSSSATRLCILKLFLLHLTTAAAPLPPSPPAPPRPAPPSPASQHATSAAPAAPSLTPAALRTPLGAGRCDADGDAMPDVSSMYDVSLLQWRWRREGERVRDVWRGGRRRGNRVTTTREGERESGACDGRTRRQGEEGGDGAHGEAENITFNDGGAADIDGVLTARKLLNPTQVITRIAPLLSRSSCFPLPPTAAAAAATVTATAGAAAAMQSDSPSPPSSLAAGALDSVDSLEARCLALRLIGCLAPLAADVAHVQELVVQAAMEAEGQQEVREGSGGRGRKRGIRGNRSSITLSLFTARVASHAQIKQPGVRGNAHRSQAEVDEHVARKRQQRQPDDSPAAHAPLHPHSFAHSLSPPHTLPPLALHTPLLTSSSHMPRVSRPLAQWRGREEGEEVMRMRVAAVVVKCLAGHEERAVRRVAWQVAVCLLSAFPCASWSPLL
ncbi:unnamed protein product [Closterium sp. Naga37s-1]|nr:unnamed protein product [Closterium sp. Naga37s-1]